MKKEVPRMLRGLAQQKREQEANQATQKERSGPVPASPPVENETIHEEEKHADR